MKQAWLILLFFSSLLSIQAVNVPDTIVRDCDEEVLITASPKPGYRFIRWTDGETDNPRSIILTQDTNITAIFDYECEDPLIPVVQLYGKLLMLDRPTFRAMGHDPLVSEVTWYRIIGAIDDPASEDRDDEQVGTGYYFIIDPTIHQLKEFYCTVPVSPPEGKHYCYDYLRSKHPDSVESEPPSQDAPDRETPAYNILGMPVSSEYRGIVIQNGQKQLQL